MRVGTSAAGLVAAACASVLLVPSPAAAASQAKPVGHCVVDLATERITCYDTFRESIAAATGGRITDAPATPAKAAEDKRFLAELDAPAGNSAKAAAKANTSRTSPRAASQVVGGFVYEDFNYGGWSWTLTIPSRCRNDGAWDATYGDLGSFWNNKITSVIPAGNCHIELHSDPHYQGARQMYTSSTPYVGDAMNDQASSTSPSPPTAAGPPSPPTTAVSCSWSASPVRSGRSTGASTARPPG